MFTLEDAVSQERKMMKSPFTPLGRNERSENGQKRKTNNTVSKEQRRDRDRKMHPAHSRVTNLAAFIGGLWDLCFSLTHRQSPVWYSPWQLHVVTNFRVVVWITLQLLNTRPTASVLCLSWTGKRLFDILWHNSFTTSASFVLGFFLCKCIRQQQQQQTWTNQNSLYLSYGRCCVMGKMKAHASLFLRSVELF